MAVVYNCMFLALLRGILAKTFLVDGFDLCPKLEMIDFAQEQCEKRQNRFNKVLNFGSQWWFLCVYS